MSLQYIKDAVESVLREMGSVTEQTNSTKSDADSSGMSQYVVTKSTHVDEIQLAQMISSIQDLIPNLGNGFITMCLKHYNYCCETVINVILEDNLAACLKDIDKSLATVGSDQDYNNTSDNNSSNTYSAMDQAKIDVMNRANIYNDDEFLGIYKALNFMTI